MTRYMKSYVTQVRSFVLVCCVTLLATLAGTSAFSQKMAADNSVTVGGAAMYPTKNIIENAMNSKDHTTLVAAVKAAGLVETLEGAGPFTVFAPTNEAFDMLPKGAVDNLLKPENKEMLQKILTYHVVAGNWDSKAMAEKIKAGNGIAELPTVSGGKLWATMKGNKLVLKDEKGGWATVTIKNVYQSNGVIHVIDHVLMPQ
ncbi:MAG TPA: fasciclin domain-containing protein [Chitinophagaceae bacterium]